MGNISPDLNKKYDMLCEYLEKLGSVAVAFSSGVDSTFLVKVASDVLGERAVAITVASSVFPQKELDDAITFCEANQIKHKIIEVDELSIPGFAENPVDRCYICKKQIFSQIKKAACEENMAYVVEGSNLDDEGDYRPGHRAINELEIKSPLREASLTKAEIRELSKALELPTWEKPSFACLASRFPYGELISKEKLRRVERAEELLRELGFRQFRVRIHGDIARIELFPDEFNIIMEESVRSRVVSELKDYGFTYVSLDLQGYRTGSLNEKIVKK